MKKIVADLEMIKKESLESLGFFKETTIYAICEKNAQVPIAFMTQISSFAGKFITIENEKSDVEMAKAFLIGYLAGSSTPKDEIALVSENTAMIEEFGKLFPKIAVKVYPTLAAAAGKRVRKPQTAKTMPEKKAPGKPEAEKKETPKKAGATPAKKKENTTSQKSMAVVKTRKAETEKAVDKKKPEAEKSITTRKKRETKAEKGDYSDLLEALKPIDREYPFEEKIQEIHTAIHDSLTDEALEMMLRLHIGKDWEYLLGLLKPHYKKLKRLAG